MKFQNLERTESGHFLVPNYCYRIEFYNIGKGSGQLVSMPHLSSIKIFRFYKLTLFSFPRRLLLIANLCIVYDVCSFNNVQAAGGSNGLLDHISILVHFFL